MCLARRSHPSLSVNWDAAVFYCFSEHCNVKGGIGRLRRLLGVRTPSYRQSGDAGGAGTARTSGDHLSGDKLGCQDTDAATERLALGLAELGSTHAQAVTECRSSFRVGKCTSCARTPAYPISCGHPLCVRCMPGRFAADWRRHASAMPEAMHILELRPHGLTPGSSGVLKQVRGRFRDWRARSGVTDGIYGARLDAAVGAVVLLAVPSDAPVPESTRAFDVEVVARDCSPDEVLRWLQSEYVDEAQSWRTGEELAFLLAETKGRRRFQGFGTGYGDGTPMDKKEEEPMADHGSEQEREERPLHKVSGGSGRGGHRTNSPACPYCDGKVELYPFTVPASEVQRVGAGWLWDGAGGSPAERRRRTP